jgi:carboxyl-terminal processing protease
MSRRNIMVIVAAALFATACYLRTDHNRYGRYLTHVLNAIDRWALEPVPQRDLFDAAMKGIVGQLDEHSTYVAAQEKSAFEVDLEQRFGGIGVIVKLEGDRKELTVVSPPRFGTPALKAGVRVRDKIVEIDGVSTVGMTIEQVVGRMRGKKGEPVELTIVHEGETRPVRLRIVRDTIDIPSVLGDRQSQDGTWDYRLARDRRIGYLRMVNFGEKTAEELAAAIETVLGQGVRAMAIDLRDNAGGLLTAAVATCELFLPPGLTIVSIRGRDEALEEVFTSSGPGMVTSLPLAILVNGYTASASEIVAACLQDHGRAVIVGARTWGKGTVQHVIPIEAGRSILKLTTASYWRPNGRNIHRLKQSGNGAWGVLPDEGFGVEVSEAYQNRLRAYRSRRDLPRKAAPANVTTESPAVADVALNRAVEYLQDVLTARSPVPTAARRSPPVRLDNRAPGTRPRARRQAGLRAEDGAGRSGFAVTNRRISAAM